MAAARNRDMLKITQHHISVHRPHLKIANDYTKSLDVNDNEESGICFPLVPGYKTHIFKDIFFDHSSYKYSQKHQIRRISELLLQANCSGF
jgi:hypothetical protein